MIDVCFMLTNSSKKILLNVITEHDNYEAQNFSLAHMLRFIRRIHRFVNSIGILHKSNWNEIIFNF